MSDDRSWNDGGKLSFSERDKRRRKPGESHDDRPRGPGAEARSQAAAQQYVKQLDGLFSKKGKGGAEIATLVSAMRAAHGTPGLADACRAYRDAAGVPDDPALIGLFLDTGDSELLVEGLEALLRGTGSDGQELSRGLRSQLRMLAQESDDRVASLAEELVEKL